jgi:uncharacterized protein (DUF302 family)
VIFIKRRWAGQGLWDTEVVMSTLPDNGMVHLDSSYSVAETVERVLKTLSQRGLTLFARIDHSGGAAAVGLEMPPTELLIFGSAKSGTPLMLAAPTLAIDLPLKALAWQDKDGKVRLSFNSTEYLKNRHSLPNELIKNIAGLPSILEAALL